MSRESGRIYAGDGEFFPDQPSIGNVFRRPAQFRLPRFRLPRFRPGRFVADWGAASWFAVMALARRRQENRTRRRAKALLRSLTDRQLQDAGIDLELAGRGKAVAAKLDPNRHRLR